MQISKFQNNFFFDNKINFIHSNARIAMIQSKELCIETFLIHILRSVQMIKIVKYSLDIHIELSKDNRAFKTKIQIVATRLKSPINSQLSVIIRDPQSLISSNFEKRYLQVFVQIGYK